MRLDRRHTGTRRPAFGRFLDQPLQHEIPGTIEIDDCASLGVVGMGRGQVGMGQHTARAVEQECRAVEAAADVGDDFRNSGERNTRVNCPEIPPVTMKRTPQTHHGRRCLGVERGLAPDRLSAFHLLQVCGHGRPDPPRIRIGNGSAPGRPGNTHGRPIDRHDPGTDDLRQSRDRRRQHRPYILWIVIFTPRRHIRDPIHVGI
ncbi:MAG: hypothetical protein CMM61_03675 [Rhodospirillaceae bacterium]|nr:hypothetical protein [Rhodospirillaceae bacterium]